MTPTGTMAVTLLLLLAGACQREGALTEPAATATTDPVQAVETAAAAETESSLAIKRGLVTLRAESRIVRFCGQDEEVWLVPQEDLTLDETYARLAGEPGTDLYVEVRGERIAAPAGTSVPATFKQALLLEELLYASIPGEGGSCEIEAPAYRVMARGNEPFWAVEVMADRLLLRQPGQPAPVQFSQQETQDAEGTVTFTGASGAQSLRLTITNTPCSDSMSGEYFAYTADLHLDGTASSGCARLGE